MTRRRSSRVFGERRRNRPLREAVDELVDYVRDVARRKAEMTPEQLDYAQERLEWLTDELWMTAIESELPPE